MKVFNFHWITFETSSSNGKRWASQRIQREEKAGKRRSVHTCTADSRGYSARWIFKSAIFTCTCHSCAKPTHLPLPHSLLSRSPRTRTAETQPLGFRGAAAGGRGSRRPHFRPRGSDLVRASSLPTGAASSTASLLLPGLRHAVPRWLRPPGLCGLVPSPWHPVPLSSTVPPVTAALLHPKQNLCVCDAPC